MTEHNPTDPIEPTTPVEPAASSEAAESATQQAGGDESFSWTSEPGAGTTGREEAQDAGASAGNTAAATATAVLEQLRVAIDDLAERATPTVREFSARAAELAATAADRAAPFAQRAGEVTSEASSKLAERSRSWAADLRASIGETPSDATGATGPARSTGETATAGPEPTTPPPPAADNGSGDTASPA